MGAAHLGAKFNKPDSKLVDHFVYAIVSDGDLMEGVAAEAASLAGHLKLGKLIYLYDDNHVTIEGFTSLAFSEDVPKRFEAYGWHTQVVTDGNNLDEMFLINLMHFAELKKRLGSKATVEHVAALFGNLNTETNFTELYKKRSDPLYHNLFFNSRLINPLDPKFEIVNGDVESGQFIVDHRPVVLSALGIRDADLSEFQALTKASDSTQYINDDLTLANLSFLHRQAWLSKLLKFKAEEWTILLKLIAQPVAAFPAEEHVLDDVEVLAQREILVDDLDAESGRIPRIPYDDRLAVDQDVAGVDGVGAADAFDQG